MNPDSCVGCWNIKKGNFPFLHNFMKLGASKSGFGIDTEGCAEGLNGGNLDDEDCAIEIFFCPVCGEKLIYP